MGQNIVAIEAQFEAIAARHGAIIPPGVDKQRLGRSLIVACENAPKLLDCTAQSLINAGVAAMTFGLECDGATGQGWLIPRKGKAQFQVGVKGIATMAGRSGFAINREVVLEDDEFDFTLGTHPHIVHKPTMGHRDTRRVIAAWATATSNSIPPLADVMDLDQLERIRKLAQTDNVWREHTHEQYKKTVVHRLSKALPVGLIQMAAAYDGMQLAGEEPVVQIDGHIHTNVGTTTIFPKDGQAKQPPTLITAKLMIVDSNGESHPYESPLKWQGVILNAIEKMNAAQIEAFLERNDHSFVVAEELAPGALEVVESGIAARKAELAG